MVAKISVGSSLYGAIAYNGEKINEAQGRLLTTNRIYNDGSGTVDIGKAMEGFLTFLPPQMKIEKPVVHISLNPHPEDVLTDIELQNIAREYLEKLGFGNQPYLVFKHEDIDRHHLHIVTVNVDENGKRGGGQYFEPGFSCSLQVGGEYQELVLGNTIKKAGFPKPSFSRYSRAIFCNSISVSTSSGCGSRYAPPASRSSSAVAGR